VGLRAGPEADLKPVTLLLEHGMQAMILMIFKKKVSFLGFSNMEIT
jgi:hypothetical protein